MKRRGEKRREGKRRGEGKGFGLEHNTQHTPHNTCDTWQDIQVGNAKSCHAARPVDRRDSDLGLTSEVRKIIEVIIIIGCNVPLCVS